MGILDIVTFGKKPEEKQEENNEIEEKHEEIQDNDEKNNDKSPEIQYPFGEEFNKAYEKN